MKKIEIVMTILAIFVTFTLFAVVADVQNERIDRFCENRTGLHGGRGLTINCTEVDSK